MLPDRIGDRSSWNTELLHEIGVALGVEGREMGVELLLGPGINMKRTPLGGRNFEYYSEDPCLSGELGAAFVNGLQSQGVGASLKHFACNNQEFEKMVTSSEVDERTLREIYLSAFERIIKKANPWTIMCSYNLLNGSYTSENEHLLNDILREEWGYEAWSCRTGRPSTTAFAALRQGWILKCRAPRITTQQPLWKLYGKEFFPRSSLIRACVVFLRLLNK
ncbi:glycoside hydrolase family 3 protein [Paenibacillus sp. DMB20]|uniref:glycoside hydrolase family 3 protein n=1 Tax=Paenibacillus sp. DMB20 TaxID=1642570 RepID=UPI002E11D9C0